MAVERDTREAPAPQGNTKKRFGWFWGIGCLIVGLLVGLGIFGYQNINNKQVQQEKDYKAEEARLKEELLKAGEALRLCKATQVPCSGGHTTIPTRHRPHHRHFALKPPPGIRPKIEVEKHSQEPTAAQIAAACNPLPIALNSQGKWKCVPPQRVEVVKSPTKQEEPDVYYPAVNIDGSNEESSLPTTNHALTCAGAGALGGLVAERNGRGAARGALVALAGDFIGTAIGGRTGGTIGCGVATGGYMINRYNHRNRGGGNHPPIITQPPPVSGGSPGVTVNPGIPGVTLN